jgi:two-component system phosphate regulon sensor histidine kinase PhoR
VSLTQRVLAGSLAIVVLLVALVVFVADRRLERRLVGDAVQQLAHEARLLAVQWQRGTNADSLADKVGQVLGRRVTLIDSSGRVIGDTDFDSPALDQLANHNTRPEVLAARDSGMGWSRRPSASAGDEELYVAVPAPLGIARISMSTRALGEIVGGAQRDILIAAALAMLVAIALTAYFARGVSRPILQLRDVAQSLAAGDLARRPELSAPGEVGDLADALSRMAEQLETRLNALEADDSLMTAMLESLNEGVIAVGTNGQVIRVNPSARILLGIRDAVPFPVTQLPRERVLRESITRALAGNTTEPAESVVTDRHLAITARPLRDGGVVLALLDLTPFRRMDAVRRDFVANVSHELRTPLTVINGFAETLAGDDGMRPEHKRFAEMIRGNAQRMQNIVDDLLDLSRIESGGWKPEPKPTDVASIARDAIAPLRAKIEARGVDVRIETDGAPQAFVDPAALTQILTNLVSNAARYTSAGAITIFSRSVPGGVEVGVSDTGSGIGADHLPRIFERFYRADAGRSRDAGGTGLGLAIVRHLVEAHGGRASVESKVGQGTTLRAFLPNAAA